MSGTAPAAQIGNFIYTDNGTTVTITGCSFNTTGAIIIPPTIYGKPVTEIGTEAFKGRSNITAITFPANMAKIGQGAFRGCAGLGSITLPSGIQTIESNLFFGCASLKSVTLPAGVKWILYAAFSDCELLSVLNIPPGVTFIDSLAFNGCDSLQSLSLPASLSNLGTSALFGAGFKTLSVAADSPYLSSSSGVLYNKSQSTLVRYPPEKTDSSHVLQASVTQIGSDAFQGSRYLKILTLPSGLTSIGGSAFASCTSLTGINIPQGISVIPDHAFFGCTNLLSITLPSALKTIGYFAFQECTNLSGITLSEGLQTIQEDAFKGCGITGIHLPASLTSLELEPFSDCHKLASITVDANNPNFSSVDGVLFNKNQTSLRRFPSARTGPYRIPYGVISLGSIAFEGAKGLTDIVIPSTVTIIGGDVFSDCDGLTRVTIPASVTTVGPGAFSICDNLNQAVFLGNAPAVSLGPFSLAAAGFTVGHYNNRTGFTSPTWRGYPTVNLGDWIDTPQDLKVEQNPGGELVNGGSVTALAATPIGSSSVVTITLTNTGNADLTNIAITQSGADSSDFQVSALNSDYLTGGDSTTFQITFSPKALGPRSAAIQITSTDADENPFELTLSGTGTAPEITVEQPGGSGVADGGSRDYGSMTVGRSSMLTFTIANSGTSDLMGLTAGITGTHAADFVVSGAPAATVAKDGSTTFVVDFKPSAAGTRVAVLRVTSNDTDESPYDIHLAGKGVAVPEITIEQPAGSGLKDGVSKKSFGTVTVGKAGRARTFIVKNTGTAKLTGLKLTRTGRDKNDFVVSALSKTQLAPGDSTSFRIEFQPSANRTCTAAIRIESNDTDENPFDIKLTGAGAAK